uniref:Putative secreted protein n=1 Tax=Ixodes ricinus TaxID=34613 RepID=A0A6B0UBX1_IXORI
MRSWCVSTLLAPLSWETATEPALKKWLRSVLENRTNGDRNATISPAAATPGTARLPVSVQVESRRGRWFQLAVPFRSSNINKLSCFD